MPQSQSTIKNSTTITGGGISTVLNITDARLVKNVAGRLVRVNVLVAGSAAGTAYDSATTGGVATANTIAIIPNTVGSYLIDTPTTNGIVVTPGTGQTIAVVYA